jgi:GNAT superfamily N-acetyltransferase
MTAPQPRDELTIRPATAADRGEVLDLLVQSLQWVPNDVFARFFAWKHEQNPFGASPAWVATDEGRIVGFRTFVRWEFEHRDGRIRRAVRAVDTATHPDYQGRGIFNRLTLHALDELRNDGVDFVFNTPNDKSRPGYLKMGWREVGRLPTAVRPASPGAIVRMLRARVPADKWSQPSTSGDAARDVFASASTEVLLERLAPPRGLRTRRSGAYLRWRYGFAELAYRAVVLDDDITRGVAVFRVRGRGGAKEAALCDLLVPGGATGSTRALERAVARAADADYVIRIGAASPASGYIPIPGQGPMLTHRAVSDTAAPGLADWSLQLGDVELF